MRRIERMISEFEQFVKERIYIKNCSADTIAFYRQSFKTWQRVLRRSPEGAREVSDFPLPTKHTLTQFVTRMREQGIKPSTCNTYIRGINSFLTWLFENGHTPEHLKIKQLKCERRVLKTFSDQQLRAIISFKPSSWAERRIHTLVLLALDTGCRIDELLTLTRGKADFDNLLVTVRGKGNKERIIPISIELRKKLFKFLQQHKFQLLFCTRHGGKLMYNNCRRDYLRLLEKAGLEKCDQSFHALRRAFAKHYVRRGGNLFYLQQAMGHSDLKTTRGYVEVEIEALRETHLRTSLLSRL